MRGSGLAMEGHDADGDDLRRRSGGRRPGDGPADRDRPARRGVLGRGRLGHAPRAGRPRARPRPRRRRRRSVTQPGRRRAHRSARHGPAHRCAGRGGRYPRGQPARLPGQRARPMLPLQERTVPDHRRRRAQAAPSWTGSPMGRTPTTCAGPIGREPERRPDTACCGPSPTRVSTRLRYGASRGCSACRVPTNPRPPAWPPGSHTTSP